VDSEDDIFLKAREISDPKERAAYVGEACGGDADLRGRVQAMLRDSAGADAFFDGTANRMVRTAAESLTEAPGTLIGRYKLLQKIGEGGMGVVYMAEQEEPVRRRVALKIIKLGMDTKSVVARFEAERQALALIDHPNIAKVLDGGATATGRPYFVMELVQGVPITEFCDKNRLGAEERIKLFIQVCQAIQSGFVAAPVPQLAIGQATNGLTISWPYSPFITWTLQQNPDLTTTTWTPAPTGGISNDGTNNYYIITRSPGNLFFRLSR
jgi:hypothetical protein